MSGNLGDELNLDELAELFSDSPATPTGTDEQPQKQEGDNKEVTPENVTTTQAFSRRLKEQTEKAVGAERERIAKSLGYESYDALVKSKEDKALREKGFDPETVKPLLDELLEQRMAQDPRFKELEAFKAKQVEEFGKRELAELTQLTDGKITKLEDVPKDVVELWKTTGSLKAAYMQLHGEELIAKVRAGQLKGSTDHLRTPTGGSPQGKSVRPLTEAEKNAWRTFYPGITDEELAKKTMPN